MASSNKSEKHSTHAGIYLRVSTKDGQQDTDNQLLQLERFSKRQKWVIFKIYKDERSGKTSERDGFQEMLSDASRGLFDVLLFWSLDRFSREGTLPTLNHLERIAKYGVRVRSYTEEWLDSAGPFKDAIIGFMAALAKQERVKISERTVAGLERARAQGKVLGRRPVGFDLKKARQMREAGDSFQVIAEALGVSKTLTMNKLKSEVFEFPGAKERKQAKAENRQRRG